MPEIDPPENELVQRRELVCVGAAEPVALLGDLDGTGGIGLRVPRANPPAWHLQFRRECAGATIGILGGNVEIALVVLDGVPAI